MKVYENKYFNPLLLNIISVRYSQMDRYNNCCISTNDYSIVLNNANRQYDNPSITLKIMLYLCNLLTDSGLNENTFIIPSSRIKKDLGISANYFDNSLRYLSSISYEYNYRYANKYNTATTNIIENYNQNRGYFKVVFSDDFIELMNYTRQFYNLPKSLLKADIKHYRNSVYLGNYIYLHKRRNKGKNNENIISVKELLKNTPLIPNYEALNEARQVKRNIIEPFEKSLNYLANLLQFNWQYNNEPKNYFEFVDSKIIFEMQVFNTNE